MNPLQPILDKFADLRLELEAHLRAYVDRRIAEAFRKFAKGLDAMADETDGTLAPTLWQDGKATAGGTGNSGSTEEAQSK